VSIACGGSGGAAGAAHGGGHHCLWAVVAVIMGGGCLKKGMTSDEQIACAFVGFWLAGAWVRWEDVVMSDRG
jgi:hypothetical protein